MKTLGKIVTGIFTTWFVSSDNSILYWKIVFGLSYTLSSSIVIVLTTISSFFLFRVGGLIPRRKRNRKSGRENWRIRRWGRAVIYRSRKKVFSRIVAKFGLHVAIGVLAFWPTYFGGHEIHVPTLLMVGRTKRIDLFIAYLIGNALRITVTPISSEQSNGSGTRFSKSRHDKDFIAGFLV